MDAASETGYPKAPVEMAGKDKDSTAVFIGQANAFAMTTRQFFSFAVVSAAIDRADSMDHMSCGQPSAGSDHSLSRWQASNLAYDLPAFGEDRRSADPVNGAIHSTSAQKR